MPWKGPDDSPSVEEEANLPPGQRLIKVAVEPTAKLIRAFVEDALAGKAGRKHSAVKWIELADPDAVAYLAARVALNSAVSRSTLQSASIALGDAIIAHVDMTTFAEVNPKGYAGLVRANKFRTRGAKRRFEAVRKLLQNEGARTAISVKEKFHLGSAVLEMLIDATGLFTAELEGRQGGVKQYRIGPTEAVQKWLDEQHARSELLDPMLMPMVVRPKRWRTPFVGGYLRKIPGQRLVKANGADYQARLAGEDLSLVYDAINHIQETPWRINRRVLDVMREVWDSGGSIAGLPPRDDQPLPTRPADIDENPEALHEWKRHAAMVYEANGKLQSQRLAVQQRLWIAEKFANEDAIWFPHNMDFRGRVYPIPATGIHPQADDTGKALLEFAHGLPVGPTGGYWLAVHIANLFGVDKVSFKERVQWTYDHAPQIIDSALNPLDGARFWTTADDPWMALAASFEFAGFLQEGESYVSRLPIPLDGSNSGLQHFSALLRDAEGAKAVNLVTAAEPQDIYHVVAVLAQQLVDDDTDPAAVPWKGGKVIRAIAKRPTMTFVYSATRFGMQGMILKTLRELDANGNLHLGGHDNYEAAKYLSHVLFEVISDVVPAAAGAMDWLRDVARVAAEAKVPLVWTTPDGLPIQQAYRLAYGHRIKVHWLGRLLRVTLAIEGSRLDSRGQTNGIAPNFVHSLDAAHLRAVARAARKEGIDYLAVIHDSFGTHAAHTDKLVRILRETFVDQYAPDVLARFREEVADQLPEELAEELPPLPEKGSLDLSEVLRSSYIFA